MKKEALFYAFFTIFFVGVVSAQNFVMTDSEGDVSSSIPSEYKNSLDIISAQINYLDENSFRVSFTVKGDNGQIIPPFLGGFSYDEKYAYSIDFGVDTTFSYILSDGSLVCYAYYDCNMSEVNGNTISYTVERPLPAEGTQIKVDTRWIGDVWVIADSVSGTVAGQQTQTCSAQGGDICSQDEICSGSWLDASDSNKCCNAVCEQQPVCAENWQCSAFGECVNGLQTRTCIDANNCGTTLLKPSDAQSCENICMENWQCSVWSVCNENNQQTRICNDLNSCGTELSKPLEIQNCGDICEEDWRCTDWSECINEGQARDCVDINSCGTDENKPLEEKICGEESEQEENEIIQNQTTEEEIECETGERENEDYCFGGEWFAQKDDEAFCVENYECMSGECFDGECISRNILDMIKDFLRGLFSFFGLGEEGAEEIVAGEFGNETTEDYGDGDINQEGQQFLIQSIPPIAFNQTVNTKRDDTVTIILNGTDDGEITGYRVVRYPYYGQLNVEANQILSDPYIEYTPRSRFNGNDSLKFQIQDDSGEWSDNATVTITVTGNDKGIDLSWLVDNNSKQVGESFDVKLMLTGRSATPTPVIGLNLPFQWDNETIGFDQFINDGNYQNIWYFIGFYPDQNGSNLNQPGTQPPLPYSIDNDGDGWFFGLAPFQWIYVLPFPISAGTFRFDGLQQGCAQIDMLYELNGIDASIAGALVGSPLTRNLDNITLAVGDVGDSDADGVNDCHDECPGTPSGEIVGIEGCSCSQFSCDDGLFCNTQEACVDGMCMPSTDPCPEQFCDEINNVCLENSPVCGNGIIEVGEVCDDGNTDSDDGCGGSCTAFGPPLVDISFNLQEETIHAGDNFSVEILLETNNPHNLVTKEFNALFSWNPELMKLQGFEDFLNWSLNLFPPSHTINADCGDDTFCNETFCTSDNDCPIESSGCDINNNYCHSSNLPYNDGDSWYYAKNYVSNDPIIVYNISRIAMTLNFTALANGCDFISLLENYSNLSTNITSYNGADRTGNLGNISIMVGASCDSICGDGIIEAGEECDDGNIDSGDGCSALCQDEGCLIDSDCDDGLFCNGNEMCNAGVCVSGFDQCDDGIACTVESCDEENDLCGVFANDSLCDDGLFCTGIETCNATLGCQAGAPLVTDDGAGCTIDSCNETLQTIIHETNNSECQINFVCLPFDDCVSIIPDYNVFDGQTTNFSQVANISNVSGAILENTQFGMINFSGNIIDFSGLNLDSYVDIFDKKIEINTSNPGMDRLNVSSRLSFYNINFINPEIRRDGLACAECNEVSYSNGVFVVDVPGFSRYEVVETGSPPGGSSSGGGSSGGGGGGGGGSPGIPPSVCSEQWLCGGWTECVDGLQTRECFDNNGCGTDENRPIESKECELRTDVLEEKETGEQVEPSAKKVNTKDILFAVGIIFVIGIVIIFVIYLIKKNRMNMKKKEIYMGAGFEK